MDVFEEHLEEMDIGGSSETYSPVNGPTQHLSAGLRAHGVYDGEWKFPLREVLRKWFMHCVLKSRYLQK